MPEIVTAACGQQLRSGLIGAALAGWLTVHPEDIKGVFGRLSAEEGEAVRRWMPQ